MTKNVIVFLISIYKDWYFILSIYKNETNKFEIRHHVKIKKSNNILYQLETMHLQKYPIDEEN